MKCNKRNDWHEFLAEHKRRGFSVGEISEMYKNRKSGNNYSQDWPAYNEAQTREKLLFLDMLGGLCSFVPIETQTMGRPRAPLVRDGLLMHPKSVRTIVF